MKLMGWTPEWYRFKRNKEREIRTSTGEKNELLLQRKR